MPENKFIIDIVRAVEDNKVKMETWLVYAKDATEAIEKFMSGDVDSQVYEGDHAEQIIIGIEEFRL